MTKSKNAGRQGKKKNAAKQEKKKEEAQVTLEALEAMSDSEDDVPEAEYNMNAKAKALRNSIKEGTFEHLIEKLKESAKDGEDEIEEVVLGSSGDEEEDEEEAVEEMDEVEEEEEQANEEEEDEDMNDEAHVKAKEFLAKAEEEEEEASSDEDDENDENVAKRRKLDANNVFNSKALSVVTEELKAAKAGMPWGETFAVVPPTPLPFGENGDPESNPLDIHDDLKREVSFYNMALEAVKEGRDKCREANIPFSRPEDFFAEMVKTDSKTTWTIIGDYPSLLVSIFISHCIFFVFQITWQRSRIVSSSRRRRWMPWPSVNPTVNKSCEPKNPNPTNWLIRQKRRRTTTSKWKTGRTLRPATEGALYEMMMMMHTLLVWEVEMSAKRDKLPIRNLVLVERLDASSRWTERL